MVYLVPHSRTFTHSVYVYPLGVSALGPACLSVNPPLKPSYLPLPWSALARSSSAEASVQQRTSSRGVEHCQQRNARQQAQVTRCAAAQQQCSKPAICVGYACSRGNYSCKYAIHHSTHQEPRMRDAHDGLSRCTQCAAMRLPAIANTFLSGDDGAQQCKRADHGDASEDLQLQWHFLSCKALLGEEVGQVLLLTSRWGW